MITLYCTYSEKLFRLPSVYQIESRSVKVKIS